MSNVVLILRHGETDWNAQNRFASHTDLELNTTGLHQAQEAARQLRHVPIDLILSSPSARARQTAAAILAARGTEPPVLALDERLRELHFGSFEGYTASEILSGPSAAVFIAWRSGVPQFPEGAETFVEAASRADGLFLDIQKNLAPVVLMVTHGHFARILLARCVLDLPVERHRRLRLDNGMFAVVRFEADMPRLVAFNTTCVDSATP